MFFDEVLKESNKLGLEIGLSITKARCRLGLVNKF